MTQNQSVRFHRYMTVTIVAASLMLTGCEMLPSRSRPVVSDPVAQGWARSFQKLGMLAVLPPTEDLRVGDVYLCPEMHPVPMFGQAAVFDECLLTSGRWGSLDVLDDLNREYQIRRSWPKTPDAYFHISPEPHFRRWAEPAADDPGTIFAPQESPRRLRMVDLHIRAAVFDGGALNDLVPTEAVNMALGTSWQDQKTITLKVGSAETYSLSIHTFLEYLLESRQSVDESGQASTAYYLLPEWADSLAVPIYQDRSSLWLKVISEVLYVRSMDMTIQARRGFVEDDEPQATGLEHGIADPNYAEVTLDPAYGAFVRARAVNDLLIETDADDVPGGFVRFINIAEDSVTLRRIWQRGLALGVRGIALKVDRKTARVEEIRTIQSAAGR